MRLHNGSALVTVEYSHKSNEDLDDHKYTAQKYVSILPPKFGPFTLTLIPKDDEVESDILYFLRSQYFFLQVFISFVLKDVTKCGFCFFFFFSG